MQNLVLESSLSIAKQPWGGAYGYEFQDEPRERCNGSVLVSSLFGPKGGDGEPLALIEGRRRRGRR
jgi:hypothetical protein